jgi:hypothetical protein
MQFSIFIFDFDLISLYRPISTGLSRQPCPAALPGSLAEILQA